MVLRGSDEPFREVGAVVVWGDKLNGRRRGTGTEEGTDVCRRFIIGDKGSDGMAGIGEELENGAERLKVGS